MMLKKIEDLVADFLISNPKLKKMVKYYYQRFWDKITHVKDIDTECLVSEVSFLDKETFFGYYDKYPENNKGYLLFHAADKTSLNPRSFSCIDIVLFDPNSDKVLYSAKTGAFNWQQGARLHWLDESHFCYNDYCPDKDDYITVLVSIDGYKSFRFNNAVADSFDLERGYLSFSYKILSDYRPDYGYFSHSNSEDKAVAIYHCYFDLEKDPEEILNANIVLKYLNLYEYDHYKFNHIMISPDKSGFVVLFRVYKGGVRHDYLCYFSLSDSCLKVFDTGRIVSHFTWINDTQLVSYLEAKDGNKKYYKLDVTNMSVSPIKSDSMLTIVDGHPSSSNGYIISDTYPDRKRQKTLYFLDVNDGSTKTVAKFYESTDFFAENRCDLHPRLKVQNGKFICYVDSVHSGKRKLYRLEGYAR